jgi:hypothetical protein
MVYVLDNDLERKKFKIAFFVEGAIDVLDRSPVAR